MQAKDISAVSVLTFIGAINMQGRSATWYKGFDNSVMTVMPADTPERVALAKMRSLEKRGLVDGCSCGCYGAFSLTERGKAMVAQGEE